MADLKPCPFCGRSDAASVIHDNFDWWVECEGCDSRSAYKKEREQAVGAWNSRNGKAA